MDELNEVGKLKLELKDETISIGKDELLIESTQKKATSLIQTMELQ